MKVIDVRIKCVKNEFDFKFTNKTTEDDIDILNVVKDKLYEICKLLLLKNCINFEDMKSFSFYIDQGKNPKARRNSYRLKNYFAKYAISSEEDLCVNYYWSLPFTGSISRNIIDILEGSGNERNLKNSLPYTYNYNTMKLKIKSTVKVEF